MNDKFLPTAYWDGWSNSYVSPENAKDEVYMKWYNKGFKDSYGEHTIYKDDEDHEYTV